jgi:hypothetical protein
MSAPAPSGFPPEPVVLRDVPLAIDPAEVRAFQAYRPPVGLPPAEEARRLDAAAAAIARVMRPCLAYRALAVAAGEPNGLVLAGGSRLHIPGIGRHWGPVEAVVAVVVTIGEKPSALVRAAGDPGTAAALDSAASAAVECLAEWANDHLCQLGVAAGLRVTNRISPGLAGWRLAEHRRLLDLVPAAELGVRLDADGRLAPAKTISCLVGVGRAARVDHYFLQCRRCWAAACPARRSPASVTVQRAH